MSPTRTSKIVNHFDLENDIQNIQGRFRYRFFHAHEQTDENGQHIKSDSGGKDVPARYVHLVWTGTSNLNQDIVMQSDTDLTHKEKYFYSIDLQKDFSIYSVRSQDSLQEMDQVLSDSTDSSSKYDYLLTKIASDENTENLEANFNNPENNIPILDPTTNMPIVSTTNSAQAQQQPPNTFLANEHINSLMRNSRKSSFTSRNFKNLTHISQEIQKSSTESQIAGPVKYLNSLDKAFDSCPDLYKFAGETFVTPTLIGYAISKYRVKGENTHYLYSRLCFQREYFDRYVAYGATYRYDIRPVYIKTVDTISYKAIFVSSDESSYIDVPCVEEKLPSPPMGINFEYTGNNKIKINWFRPQSIVEDNIQNDGHFDSDDIKGYQIFIRNSIEEPYQLVKYFTFNNTHPPSLRMYAVENIPQEYIQHLEQLVPEPVPDPFPTFREVTSYSLSIRPNQDYYFALCSIDAHGNSSAYSSQYKVRRNNVTGEVFVVGVSSSGAPKQYPNMFYKGSQVKPSFSVSKYKNMDVYYAPDTKFTQTSRDDANAATIQMFDLTTQKEKTLTLGMYTVLPTFTST